LPFPKVNIPLQAIEAGQTLSISAPIFAGLSVTITPALSRAATLSTAAPVIPKVSRKRRGNTILHTLATGNDSTSVTHASARGGSASRDEPNDRFRVATSLVVFFKELGSLLFHGTTNFTDDNDALSCIIVHEDFKGIYVLGTREWIATNTNTKRLAETNVGGLSYGFICEGSRTRNNA
jgi:hypothetical protein